MRYSLRTLLLVMTVLVVWLGYQAELIHRQRAATRAIEQLHGSVEYDDSSSDSAVRNWLARWLGRDAVSDVDAVYLAGAAVDDDDLAWLKELPRLRTVVLTSSPISDAGLRHLRPLTHLETVDLRFITEVTDEGIASLRRALPEVKILGKSDIE